MARQSKTKLLKRQREFDRMRKAKEKMDRRHDKKTKEMEEAVATESFEQPDQA